MAITTYAELQTAVGNWLNRSDLTGRIPEFIALAEADIRRKLRSDVVIDPAFSIDAASEPLPAACAELRSIRFNTSSRQYPLTETTVENLAHLRRSGSGAPHYYAVADDTLLLDITPDTSYVMEIVYFDKLIALSVASPNATLTNSPDIYLYGSLKEAELYLEHDERNPVWAQKYNQAINDENVARERKELGAAPVARLPIVLG